MSNQNFLEILRKSFQNPLPGHKKADAYRKKLDDLFPVKANEFTKQSAVLIMLYPGKKGLKFPLILRPQYDGKHGGQVSLPGGKKELVDESLERTAIRETQEEIGIKALDLEILGAMTEVFIPVSNFVVQPYVAYLPYKPQFFPDEREVDKLLNFNLNDLILQEDGHQKNKIINNQEVLLKGFICENQFIWGATALILSEFQDLLIDR